MEDIQAFPVLVASMGTLSKLKGMTLRDYFAGQALIALMSDRATYPVDIKGKFFTELCAERSYEYADAMLKARTTHDK